MFEKKASMISRAGACAVVAAVAVAPAIATASATAHKASTVVISAGKVKRGTVVVSSSGLTLYGLTSDHGSSTCYGSCAKTWIPWLTHGGVAVKSGSGLSQKLVGKTKRSNGVYQITYGGHPLYHYVGDKKAGTQNGQNAKLGSGHWDVVSTKGKLLKPSSGLVGGY